MSPAERTIRRTLAASCGNGGHPTDHAIERIAAMLERGEATIELIRQCGGDYLVQRVEKVFQGKVTA